MSSFCLKATAMIAVAVTIGLSTTTRPARSADSLAEQTSTTQTTQAAGDPIIIQHVNSKMEPIAVQSRETTNAAGEKQNVVEPLIMERHEKVLDTTIIQPEVTETTKTTKQVLQSKQTHSYVPPAIQPIKHRPRVHLAHVHHTATRKTAYHVPAKHALVSSNTQLMQTTEVTRQQALKETTVTNTAPDNNPPAPQVVQKTESR